MRLCIRVTGVMKCVAGYDLGGRAMLGNALFWAVVGWAQGDTSTSFSLLRFFILNDFGGVMGDCSTEERYIYIRV